jgi:hypothetical protein
VHILGCFHGFALKTLYSFNVKSTVIYFYKFTADPYYIKSVSATIRFSSILMSSQDLVKTVNFIHVVRENLRTVD